MLSRKTPSFLFLPSSSTLFTNSINSCTFAMRRSARTPRKPEAFVPDADGKGGDFQDGGVPRGLLTSPEASSKRASRRRSKSPAPRVRVKPQASAASAGKPDKSSPQRRSRSRSPAMRSLGAASAAPAAATVKEAVRLQTRDRRDRTLQHSVQKHTHTGPTTHPHWSPEPETDHSHTYPNTSPLPTFSLF